MNLTTFSEPKTENAITIVVTEAIADTLCLASGDGQKLYERIAPLINEGKNVIIDFQNVEETTPAFMDEAIAQLYENFPEEQVEKSLSFLNINSHAAYDIEDAVYWTKEYLKDPQRFKEAGIKVLGEDYGVHLNFVKTQKLNAFRQEARGKRQ